MSKNRYVIKISTLDGDKSLSFRLKTILNDEQGFIDEVKNYVDWEEKIKQFNKVLDKSDESG
jgi:hypothetical protein